MLLCNGIHMLMQYYGKEPFCASFSQAHTPSLGEGRSGYQPLYASFSQAHTPSLREGQGGYQSLRAITILSFPY